MKMDEHLLTCYGDQSLANAFAKRDLEAFRRALKSGSDAESYDNESSTSIFEQACQQPNCEKFIEECLMNGCDVNKVNPVHQKCPINFAAESFSPSNLSALLMDPNVNLDWKYASCTPINFLCEQITDAKFNDIFPCIELFVKHHADLNIGNRREITPILNILKNKNLNEVNKRIIAEYFLDNAVGIDIDTKRNGEARSMLSKVLSNRILPPVVQMNSEAWDFNELITCLRNENEIKFLQGLNAFTANASHENLRELFTAIDNDETLLISAVKRDLVVSIERMLRLGADINLGVKKTPVEFACIFGHWKSLGLLLMSPNINLNTSQEPLLSIVVRHIGERTTNKCNYEKCFQLLLKNQKIDIDQEDMTKSSALHYAVKYNNPDVVSDLLKKGAYLGVKNSFNQYSISNINPKILEKHLDNCITTNELRTGDDNFEILFDYTNLVPPQTRQEMINESKSAKFSENCPDEMAPISFISQSNDLRHLIRHPLIASFLFLKWHRLAFIFYLNFAICALFSASTVTYILVCYNEDETSGTFSSFLRCATFLLIFYMILRELFQLTLSPCNYAKSWENYLEIVLIICTLAILTTNNDTFTESRRRTVASATILLIAIEIFLLAGSLPFWSFSTHYVMLITVSKSFLKSLLLYAIILLAFALSFFTLLREPMKLGSKMSNSDTKTSDNDEEDDFNKFGNVGLSIMKTLVMSTGEFDAASINFNLNTWSYVFFVIFLFLISTVLFNLLNGLAVSDTQVIKSEAELTNFIQRSQVLARYERILIGQDNSFCYLNFMRYFARSRISVFKTFIPTYKIRVKPNDNNQILVETFASDSKKDMIENDFAPVECISGCPCAGRCSRMEKKIIKLASNVLEKIKREKYEEAEKEHYKNRIVNIEASLHDITQKLNILLNKRSEKI